MEIYRSYLAANHGFQGACRAGENLGRVTDSLSNTVDKTDKMVEQVMASIQGITAIYGKQIENLPDTVASKVNDAMMSVKDILKHKDEHFLLRLVSRITKHSVGIVAAIVGMYNSTTLVQFLSAGTTLASMLGLEQEVFMNFCRAVSGVISNEPDIELQASFPAEKIGLLATALIAFFGGDKTSIGGFISKASLHVRNAEAIQKMWKLLEDIAAELGFPITERSHQMTTLKEKIQVVLDKGLEHQMKFTHSPSDYCRETDKAFFNEFKKELLELKQLVNSRQMKDVVSGALISEVMNLCRDFKKMDLEISRMASLTGIRPEPVGIVIVGESGLGKSAFVETLLTEVRAKLKEDWQNNPNIPHLSFAQHADSWQIWDQNPSDDYDQGYVGQEIHSIDDIFQRADQKDHAKVINYVSTRSLPTHQAALEEKGLPYKARLLIGTCNYFPDSSVVINDINALSNRFMFKVEVSLKPGARKPTRGGGELDPSFGWMEMRNMETGVRISRQFLVLRIVAAVKANEQKYLAALKAYFDRKEAVKLQIPLDLEEDIIDWDDGLDDEDDEVAHVQMMEDLPFANAPIDGVIDERPPENPPVLPPPWRQMGPNPRVGPVPWLPRNDRANCRFFRRNRTRWSVSRIYDYEALDTFPELREKWHTKKFLTNIRELSEDWKTLRFHCMETGVRHTLLELLDRDFSVWNLVHLFSNYSPLFDDQHLDFEQLCSRGFWVGTKFSAGRVRAEAFIFLTSEDVNVVNCRGLDLERKFFQRALDTLPSLGRLKSWLNTLDEWVGYLFEVPFHLLRFFIKTLFGRDLLDYGWGRYFKEWLFKLQGFMIGWFISPLMVELVTKLVRKFNGLVFAEQNVTEEHPVVKSPPEIVVESPGQTGKPQRQRTRLVEDKVSVESPGSTGKPKRQRARQVEAFSKAVTEKYANEVTSKKHRIAKILEKKLILDSSASENGADTSEGEDVVVFPSVPVDDPKCESSEDPNAIDLVEKIMSSNVVPVRYRGATLYGWAFRNLILFPSHLVNSVNDVIVASIRGEDVQCVVSALEREWDLAMAVIPKTYSAYPDIRKYMQSDEEIVSGKRYKGLLAYPTRKTCIVQVVNYEFRDEVKTVKQDGTPNVVKPIAVTRGLWTNGINTQAGDCGGPLVEVNVRSAKKLIGMHVASGGEGIRGYTTLVTTDRVDKLIMRTSDLIMSKGDVICQQRTNVCRVRRRDVLHPDHFHVCFAIVGVRDVIVPYHISPLQEDIEFQDVSLGWIKAKFVSGDSDRDISLFRSVRDTTYGSFTPLLADTYVEEDSLAEVQVPLLQSMKVWKARVYRDGRAFFLDGSVMDYALVMFDQEQAAEAESGDCGSPYYDEQGKICGIVTFSASGVTPVGGSSFNVEVYDHLKLMVPRKVESTRSSFFPKVPFAPVGPLNSNDGKFFTDGGYGHHLPEGNFGYWGDVIGPNCNPVSSQTELKKTIWSYPFDKKKVPSALTLSDPRVKDVSHLPVNGYGNKSLIMGQVMKYGDEDVEMDESLLMDMKDQLVDYSVQVLSGEKVGVCSDEARQWWYTINGKPDREEFAPMNVKASVGVPWCRDNTGSKKLHYLEDSTATYHGKTVPGKVPKDTAMWSATLAKMEYAKEGLRTHSVWKDCLKDELRVIEKVEAPKTRLFSCAPMETVLCARYLFEPYKAAWTKHRDKLFHSVGIDTHSSAWAALYKDLQARGKDVADGDFSCFDGRLPAPLMEAVGLLIIQTIDRLSHDGMGKARTVIWDEFVRTISVAEDTVYMTTHGNPSGNPMTTVMNCWCNFFLHWYVFRQVTGKHTLQEFIDVVCFRSFGDDCVYSVRCDYTSQYNPTEIAARMKLIGQEYTNGSKTVQGSFSRLDEVQYLKRKFRPVGGTAAVFAPLEKTSIEGCFNYSQINSDDGETWANTAFEQLLEMSLHGRDYFNACKERLEKRLRYIARPVAEKLVPVIATSYDAAKAEMMRRNGVSAVFRGE